MSVQRWTSNNVNPSDFGGFVTYGDYLALEKQLSAITAENEQLQAQVAMLREACIEMRSHEARPSVQRMADEAIRSTDGQEYVNRELDEQAKLLLGELNRADAAEAQVASLYDALGRITKKYFDAPDGPLGCGFTNHDFFHAEKVRLSTTQTAEAYKRRIHVEALEKVAREYKSMWFGAVLTAADVAERVMKMASELKGE